MVSSVSSGSAVSQVNATKAPAEAASKIKSFLSKAVSSLAHTLLIPQALRQARALGFSKPVAIAALVTLGPTNSVLLLGGIASVKKLFTGNPATQEKQPLLLGKEKSL